ncbi:sulfite exporter family protein [Colletotrichum incanum]|uniref:Sulfite exporter family protein n=1 Tax=Colletotrichum incanum TaxID=1573173 RepID=A0A167A3L7_COLIC|nr:sulfite exporter family protein [Colletotrichum incanum]
MARCIRLITWGLLLLCLQLAVAHVAIPVRRQEAGTSTAAIASSIRSESARDAGTTTSPSSLMRSTSVTTTASVVPSSSASSPSAIPTLSGGGNTFDNSSLFNTTIPEGQLPIEPIITPGWGVAGVILLCTGVIYTLIGIKNTVLHNAFSVAYVVGLGIAVLVVYVMVVPVSNASQGAYVVAAVLPAVFAGVLSSWFFKEITECLACALGGFCFAMWLLCLHDGGLLSGIGKVVFIIVFSLAGFATYFTRWTRDWALMITISFSGATATVLGIDCFSRAGLKEFWAYVWDLNDNLFPMGADTYPLTKGIRVEIAAIIVIFCIGIISQKRLWNVIKDRRAKRDEELAEAQRARDEEESNIGKELEARIARERREWERVHGDYVPNGSDHDSGFARDSESEKGTRYSQSTATPRSQAPPVAEMAGSEVPLTVHPKPTATGLMVSEKEKDGVVTVRVASDDTITNSNAADRTVGEKGAARPGSTVVESIREVAPAPEVVPLPFRFPDTEESMAREKEDRSTIATFAADDDEAQMDVGSKRSSFAKRLSRSSVQIMRRVSQRTSASLRNEDGRGDEEMIVRRRPQDDDVGSIAATIDTQNDSGASIDHEALHRSIDINAQLADEQPADQKAERKSTSASRQSMSGESISKRVSAMTIASDAATQPPARDAVSPIVADMPVEEVKRAVNGIAQDSTSTQQEQASPESSLQPSAPSQKAKSLASVDSTPVNLTQERLPSGFSNVALHYRTNEWAKHLSLAEAPEPDALQLAGSRPQSREAPAPVHVEELQQTALSATPAPVPTKSPAPIQRPLSNCTPSRGHSRNGSYQSHRRGSSKTQFEPIAEEDTQVVSKAVSTKSGSSGPVSGVASPVTPIVFERPPPPPGIQSYNSPQSLIAQRSVALHNKTYGILTGANTMPEIPPAAYRVSSESGSMHNYPVYPQQMPPASLDDLPLSQRKEIIRRQSSFGTVQSSMGDSRPASGTFMPGMSAESVAFDSHQPMRYSSAPSQEARDARLASFRNSVRADLRAGMAASPAAANGRDMTLSMYRSPSATNLASQNVARESDLQRNIDLQRSFLMSQKEAEAKRKEKERLDKERSDQAFTRSMQSGEMFELHREAMRKMQNRARNA